VHFYIAQQNFLAPPTQSHTSRGRADEGLGIPLISLSGSNSST